MPSKVDLHTELSTIVPQIQGDATKVPVSECPDAVTIEKVRESGKPVLTGQLYPVSQSLDQRVTQPNATSYRARMLALIAQILAQLNRISQAQKIQNDANKTQYTEKNREAAILNRGLSQHNLVSSFALFGVSLLPMLPGAKRIQFVGQGRRPYDQGLSWIEQTNRSSTITQRGQPRFESIASSRKRRAINEVTAG